MNLLWISLSVLAIIVLWIGIALYQRHQLRKRRAQLFLGPPPGRNTRRNYRKWSFWLRNLYSPLLPNVSRYGGTGDLFRHDMLTSEYPRASELNTEGFEQQRPEYFTHPALLQANHVPLFQQLWQVLNRTSYRLLADIELIQLVGVTETDISALHQQRLQGKKLDFVICTPELQVAGVILLPPENRAQQKAKQQIEARFIETVLEQVNIPVLFLTTETDYQIEQLQHLLSTHLNLTLATPQKVVACPTCGAPMKKTRPKSGKHAGKLFLVCSHYPTCRTAKPLQ